jgi:uncharacterized protein
MKLEKTMIDSDGERLACEFVLRDKNAIILHGAGASKRQRYYPIAEELLKNGIGVVLFDFSGHGESTGELKDLSLARRQAQAASVIDSVVPADSPLYLCGFSMGAQTVCDILPRYGGRTEAVLLGCPAIYAADVQGTRFGDPAFTGRLREHESWTASGAPASLSGFGGKTVIAIGDRDEIIPDGVVGLLKAAAKDLTFKEYAGAPHALAAWLESHPGELTGLTGALLSRT